MVKGNVSGAVHKLALMPIFYLHSGAYENPRLFAGIKMIWFRK